MTGPPAPDHTAFIRAHTAVLAVPHAPEIRLHLADEATALWRMTEEELAEAGLPPPFWAFAWAGGQGLARHILDHPDLVRGRRVFDFASGSGLVAIAAAMAGAVAVTANEIDPFGPAAIALNAAENGVVLSVLAEDRVGDPLAGFDTVLAGDVFYDRAMTERAWPWLKALAASGRTVLVGDPGRTYRPAEGLDLLATYSVPVTRALEDGEIKRTTVLAVRG
ncbi:class I SAM-dependent methyltransferase [Prosthecomicrobium pneumaticum]|uniref:Putative nicotinamide N-methyase n=1 Tax=Prosthecomicrobium pneumaticum TaxID=81895 RepID=A0A7W9L2L8_9HYPH|nr:methyltransferase [Prosthecomicrobium pneumaticum]MBB5753622.1 putative nicotinamide N-methyase [Prosthecomicrobium pneumaticum]